MHDLIELTYMCERSHGCWNCKYKDDCDESVIIDVFPVISEYLTSEYTLVLGYPTPTYIIYAEGEI